MQLCGYVHEGAQDAHLRLRAQSRLAPTGLAHAGTPIQNNMEELYGIMSLLDPDEFGEEAEFLERYGGSREQPMPSAEQVVALQARAPTHRHAQQPLQRCKIRSSLPCTPSTPLQCCRPQMHSVKQATCDSHAMICRCTHPAACSDVCRLATTHLPSSPDTASLQCATRASCVY